MSGKKSDKAAGRPQVPEVAIKLRAYRALPGRYVGGCVHIITDDGNTEQHWADWCAEHARQWGEEWGDGFVPEDQEIADLLQRMTTSQRHRVYELNTYPDFGHEEWADQLRRWGYVVESGQDADG